MSQYTEGGPTLSFRNRVLGEPKQLKTSVFRKLGAGLAWDPYRGRERNVSQKSLFSFAHSMIVCFATWSEAAETLFRISLIKSPTGLEEHDGKWWQNTYFWVNYPLNSNLKNLKYEWQSSSCFNKRSKVLNVLPSYHKRSKLPISSFQLKTHSLFSSSVPEKRANHNAKAK